MSDVVCRRNELANQIAALCLSDSEAPDGQLTALVEEWHSLFLFSPENAGPSAPWEPGMFNPLKHEESMPPYLWRAFPLPWSGHGRGNGHVDYYDSDGKFIVHVYFWDRSYREAWNRIVERIEKHYEGVPSLESESP